MKKLHQIGPANIVDCTKLNVDVDEFFDILKSMKIAWEYTRLYNNTDSANDTFVSGYYKESPMGPVFIKVSYPKEKLVSTIIKVHKIRAFL